MTVTTARAGADYDERRMTFLRASAASSATGRVGVFPQIARAALAEPVDPDALAEACRIVDDRIDSSDFTLTGLQRLLGVAQQRSGGLTLPQIDAVEETVLGARYWWDEPGDQGALCYHTENHQALFHAAEIAAGSLLPHATLTSSGHSSAEAIDHGSTLLRRWMALRAAAGWSEWLSNTYTEHNVLALCSVIDFAPDPQLRSIATGLLDVLLVEIASNSFDGVLGSTHGRAYVPGILDGSADGATTLLWSSTGLGTMADTASVGAVALATSTYRPPAILEQLAAAPPVPVTMRERQSFDVGDAAMLGLGFEEETDGNAYWAMQEFMHPDVLPLTRRIQERYGLGLDRHWEDFAAVYDAQRAAHGTVVDPDRDLHAMPAADITTSRRPAGMLSSVQAFRPGTPGYQHHVWQATLGPRAIVFTNHPGTMDLTSRPNFLAGNGVLPLVVQHENLLVARYAIADAHIEGAEVLPFTHAYLPAAEFDDVAAAGAWTFARRGGGVVGLWCSRPTRRVDDTEVRADDGDAVWLCVLDDGELDDVVGRWRDVHPDVTADRVTVRGPDRTLTVTGTGRPGSTPTLTVDDRPVRIGRHPRFTASGIDVSADGLLWTHAEPPELHVDLSATLGWRTPAPALATSHTLGGTP